MKEAALSLFRAGLNVIPLALDGSKAPAIKKWRAQIATRPTEEYIARVFDKPCGLGVLGGETSGGLEIIDFDRAGVFDEWAALVDHLSPGLLARLPVVKTPNGHHVYVRSACCAPNQKLAMGLEKTADKKSAVKIETRGHGGYVIAPPSPATVHASGVLYVHVSGPPLTEVPTLTEDEHELLFSAARSFHEVEPEKKDTRVTTPGGEGRPGDDFNARASWAEILQPHGWVAVREFGRVTHWRRPGKADKGISATTGYCQDRLYAFSSNAQPFDSGRAYNKFGAYVLLNCGGDFAEGGRQLRAKGFGAVRDQQPNKPSAAKWQELADGLDRINGKQPDNFTPPPSDADAPPDIIAAPPKKETITAERLEALIDDDPAAFLRPGMLERIVAVRDDDRAEWSLICDMMRRKKKKGDFNDAVKRFDADRKKLVVNRNGWKRELIYRENTKGEEVLDNCLSNHVLILTNDPQWLGVLGFDEFSNQITTRSPPPFARQRGQWGDADALQTKMWIEKHWGLRPSTAAICEAILTTAKEHAFNHLIEYLDGLEDQGRNAIDTWLIDFFGAPDTPYVRAVGRKWLISAVARAYDPGCKVDTVLILEGKQGFKKSRVLEQLCPNLSWFTDGLSDFGSKAQAEEVEGKWIIELAEMKGFGRELEQIKAFITRKAENYRPAYARYNIHSPRKCVFAATVNPSAAGYLRDDTGNRRYWPIECTKRAAEMTPQLRDQLWAEARSLYKAGESWWIEDDELQASATAEQDKRLQLDPWHEIIEAQVVGTTDVSPDELLDKLKVEAGKRTIGDTMRVGRVMAALKWVRYQQRHPDGRRTWRYRPATYQPELQLTG